MKTEPADVDQRDLARVLREQWALTPERLQYAPVGFGDYHWDVTDTAGDRWFVTVADLRGGWRGTGPAAGYADLRAAMETVTAVRQAGLDFAVAPVATTAGQVLAALGAGHAVTVFPHIDGAAGDFGAKLAPADRLALIDILAELHDAPPRAARMAPARSPALATRPILTAALGELDRPWDAGPYGEPARWLLAAQAPQLERALAQFDELVQEIARTGPAVLTHGEPSGQPAAPRRAAAADRLGHGRARPARAGPVAGRRRRPRAGRPVHGADRAPGQPGRPAPVPAALEPGRHRAVPPRFPGRARADRGHAGVLAEPDGAAGADRRHRPVAGRGRAAPRKDDRTGRIVASWRPSGRRK